MTNLVRVAADQATTRAARRATVLPLLSEMSTSALCAELRLRAEDDERLLAAAGVTMQSPLRQLADGVPRLASRATELVVRTGQLYARAINGLAGRLEAADIRRSAEAGPEEPSAGR